MGNFSFDIVSEYDKAEMNNVFDQALREIASRYDFKGTPAELDWLREHIYAGEAGRWRTETFGAERRYSPRG